MRISNHDWQRWQSGTFSGGDAALISRIIIRKFLRSFFDGTDIAKHKHCQSGIRAQHWQERLNWPTVFRAPSRIVRCNRLGRPSNPA